ncbi:MAG: transposase [Planctomycetota bacterium]|nr:transposase [Planctomycetota bacterium]
MASARPPRTIFDLEGHLQFVTFSCYRKFQFLSRDRCKQIVLAHLDRWGWQERVGVVGYVVMPDHVHALLRPAEPGRLSPFMQLWKRESSRHIHAFLRLGGGAAPFGARVRDDAGRVHCWNKRYYPFNVYSMKKAIQKLEYMHHNPVRQGLAEDPCAWAWSSARYWQQGIRPPVRMCGIEGSFPWERSAKRVQA